MSLERRADSVGSSGDDSGSDSFLPSTPGPNEPFKSPFSNSNVSSMNLSSTIDNVGDGDDGSVTENIQKIDNSFRLPF
ncbi:hypothetical protein BASA83_012706 [Batrachochytrium salamandrivorans]|nr:hypothetical protein BASA83_012706 [Batrachochytrium salamandrivorans]